MSMIEAIATDIKISIDDFIHELKKMKKDIRVIKRKLELDKPDEDAEDYD